MVIDFVMVGIYRYIMLDSYTILVQSKLLKTMSIRM